MVTVNDLRTRPEARAWALSAFIGIVLWLVFFGAACDKGSVYNFEAQNGGKGKGGFASHTTWESYLAYNSKLNYPAFFIRQANFGNFTNIAVDHSVITCTRTTANGDVPMQHNFAAAVCTSNQKNCALFNDGKTPLTAERGQWQPIKCTAQAYDAANNAVASDFFLFLCGGGTPGDSSAPDCTEWSSRGANDFSILGSGQGARIAMTSKAYHNTTGALTATEYSLNREAYDKGTGTTASSFFLFFNSFDVWHYKQVNSKDLPPFTNGFDFFMFMTFMSAASYLCIHIHAGIWWLMRRFFFPNCDITYQGTEKTAGFSRLDNNNNNTASDSYGATA